MRELLNKTPLLRLLYPTIIDWARDLDYSIPSITVLSKYSVMFNEVESWMCTYNGEPTEAIGLHRSDSSIITVASKRDKLAVYSTLIHEFAHAVQFFNLGTKMHEEYRAEAKVHAHSENSFENEARTLQKRFLDGYRRNSIFRQDLDIFEFDLANKPGPKRKTAKPKPTLRNGTTLGERSTTTTQLSITTTQDLGVTTVSGGFK